MSDSIERTLGRIENKMDNFLEKHNDLKTVVDSHNMRISRVEGLIQQATGWVLALGAVFGVLWGFTSKAIAAAFTYIGVH